MSDVFELMKALSATYYFTYLYFNCRKTCCFLCDTFICKHSVVSYTYIEYIEIELKMMCKK